MKTEDNKINPLSRKIILEQQSWSQWKSEWERTTSVASLCGLLHEGFNTRETLKRDPITNMCSPTERLLFFLQVANGWTTNVPRILEEGESKLYFLSHARTKIARKAFEVLCRNSFKNLVDNPNSHNYKLFFTSKDVLTDLMYFFGHMDENYDFVLYNVGFSGHKELYAQEFIRTLVRVIWRYERYLKTLLEQLRKTKEHTDEINRMFYAKMWTIEILYALGRLDDLEVKDASIDETVVKKLEEIALRVTLHSPHVDKSRKVRTLAEARKTGDSAAWYLAKYLTTRVKKRKLT